MFHQLLTPVGDSLALSFLVAVLPIATVLVLLGILKRPAWQAAFAGLAVGLLIAATVWGVPVRIAAAAALNGAVFALWPVMWIVILRAAAVQRCRRLGPLRGLPRMDHPALAE